MEKVSYIKFKNVLKENKTHGEILELEKKIESLK